MNLRKTPTNVETSKMFYKTAGSGLGGSDLNLPEGPSFSLPEVLQIDRKYSKWTESTPKTVEARVMQRLLENSDIFLTMRNTANTEMSIDNNNSFTKRRQ